MKTTLLVVLTLTAGLAEARQTSTAAKAAADRPQAVAATTQMDARFNGWLGCWRLEDDLAGTGARMCITPDQTGVRLQTIVGTQRGLDELLIADGVARPIADSECKGTERAEWSQDGLRVFRITDVTCDKETPRTIKGVAFLAPGPAWINVQHITGTSATTGVRVQRYRRAISQNLADGSKAPQPSGTASAMPTARDATWSIDDVIEASGKLPAEALQAALADVRHGFNMNKNTLVKLDDAGVPDGVIDLMVALTFPKRFVVERAGGSAPIGVSTGMGWYDPFMSPMFMGAYGNCYTDRYYGYRSYYNMCGSYYGSYYSPYGGYYSDYNYLHPGGGWVAVDPNPPAVDSGNGRAINGRGYTQIRERSPEPTPSRVSNGGNGTAAGYSGGGGVSSGGYSSGSSGGSSSGGGGGGASSGGGDRTAVARPPGGGN
jgi:hypothetical protein